MAGVAVRVASVAVGVAGIREGSSLIVRLSRLQVELSLFWRCWHCSRAAVIVADIDMGANMSCCDLDACSNQSLE